MIILLKLFCLKFHTYFNDLCSAVDILSVLIVSTPAVNLYLLQAKKNNIKYKIKTVIVIMNCYYN